MTYLAELDDRPIEIEAGLDTNTVQVWPKDLHVTGGLVPIDGSPDPVVRVFNPGGEELAGASVAAQSIPSTPFNVSRLDVTIDASNTSAYPLGDLYRFELIFFVANQRKRESKTFSVVREPFVPVISSNEFVEEIADAGEVLAGQVAAYSDSRTVDQHASVLGVKAWNDVHRWLQARAVDERKIYARLVLDRWKLLEVVIAQAIMRMWRAEGGSERALKLREEWAQEAKDRFAGLGTLEYDGNDDGVADTPVRAPVQKSLRRSW